ncbi:hypothetical protein PPMP20_00580 [Paraburkholderia phymatum]|uniref:hypothetical protein n=1 Tax=Paraburkholderia phymatum TaxID=148447 RepID=UPI00031F5B90|nr:hypothetical protein [Paraburkholderia phymatum]
MRHDFADLEQAAFWVHVVVAVILLLFMAREKNPAWNGWLALGEQSILVDFSPASLMPELTCPD